MPATALPLVLPDTFTASCGTGRYVCLNPGNKVAIIFSYGAGNRAIWINRLQLIARDHPELSFLGIDRWPGVTEDFLDEKQSVSILEKLTTFTIELLRHLSIEKVTIVSHSAGVYAQLHFAKSFPDMIHKLVLLVTHIPSKYLDSQKMSLMLKLPRSLFDLVTSVVWNWDVHVMHYMDAIGFAGRKADFYDTHIGSKELHANLYKYHVDYEDKKSTKLAKDVDYSMLFERIPGLDTNALVALYQGCPVPLVWFTSKSDELFNTKDSENFAKQIGVTADFRVVEDTNHGFIMERLDVWNEVVRLTTP